MRSRRAGGPVALLFLGCFQPFNLHSISDRCTERHDAQLFSSWSNLLHRTHPFRRGFGTFPPLLSTTLQQLPRKIRCDIVYSGVYNKVISSRQHFPDHRSSIILRISSHWYVCMYNRGCELERKERSKVLLKKKMRYLLCVDIRPYTYTCVAATTHETAPTSDQPASQRLRGHSGTTDRNETKRSRSSPQLISVEKITRAVLCGRQPYCCRN